MKTGEAACQFLNGPEKVGVASAIHEVEKKLKNNNKEIPRQAWTYDFFFFDFRVFIKE